MVAPPAYRKYHDELCKGPIAHLDRVKINVLKNRLDLSENWWKASIFCNDHGRPKKRFWNMNKLPDDLKGTRLTIQGNNFIIELHNILNRYPSIDVINMYRRVLAHLKEHGIFNNPIEEVVSMATATEIEIRYDFFARDVYKKLDDKRFSDNVNGTLYFTFPKNYRLRKRRPRSVFYMYPKGDHHRFEIILQRRSLDKLRGTSKDIIQRLNIESSLRTRFNLYRTIWPLIKQPRFFEDFIFDFEELFRLSNVRNQYTEVWI